MFNESQTRRLARKFEATILKALDAFPEMLDATDGEVAAEIVAGIIKTQLTTPTPEPNPADALALVMQRISQMPTVA